MDDVGLDGEAVADMGDVLDVEGGPLTVLIGRSLRAATTFRAGVEADLVFLGADLGGAGGENEVLGVDGVGHIGGRDAVGEELVGTQIHHDVALFAAIGVGNFNARNGDQLGADGIGGQVEKSLFREWCRCRWKVG